jgi:hypothetical protein
MGSTEDTFGTKDTAAKYKKRGKIRLSNILIM